MVAVERATAAVRTRHSDREYSASVAENEPVAGMKSSMVEPFALFGAIWLYWVS